MSRPMATGILVFATVICGCVPSLHPLYTEEDLIFDEALVGRWVDEDADEIWMFEKAGEKQYTLTYTDKKGKKGEFDVHLLKVEGHLFLDLYPVEPDLEQNDFYKFHLLPIHTFMHVKQIEPALAMRVMDMDWFRKFLKDHPDAIAHEVVRDDFAVLTAQPKALQQFFVAHLDTEEAYGECSDLRRAPEPAPESEPPESKSEKPGEGSASATAPE